MITPAPTPRPDRRWYELSLRHLRMSSRLLRLGFADGSCFHTYHGFECGVSALIAAKGWPVPPVGRQFSPRRRVYYNGPSGQIFEPSTHKIRLILFDEVADRSKPYYATFAILKRILTNPMRNDTLYYDPVNDLVPRQQFNESFALGLYQQVRQWVRKCAQKFHSWSFSRTQLLQSSSLTIIRRSVFET